MKTVANVTPLLHAQIERLAKKGPLALRGAMHRFLTDRDLPRINFGEHTIQGAEQELKVKLPAGTTAEEAAKLLYAAEDQACDKTPFGVLVVTQRGWEVYPDPKAEGAQIATNTVSLTTVRFPEAA